MSKYKNQKCEYIFQGATYQFSSKLERSHAIQLFNRLKQGEIEGLVLQPTFILCESTTLFTNSTKSKKTKQRQILYIADFKFIQDGETIVADSKGYSKAGSYPLKKKLFLSQLMKHGVDEFREIYKAETITYRRYNGNN